MTDEQNPRAISERERALVEALQGLLQIRSGRTVRAAKAALAAYGDEK